MLFIPFYFINPGIKGWYQRWCINDLFIVLLLSGWYVKRSACFFCLAQQGRVTLVDLYQGWCSAGLLFFWFWASILSNSKQLSRWMILKFTWLIFSTFSYPVAMTPFLHKCLIISTHWSSLRPSSSFSG